MEKTLLGLEDKIVVVVGGGGKGPGIGKGIGVSTCLMFARAGAHLVVVDRVMSRAEAVADKVVQMGQKALPLDVDVLQANQVNEMVRATLAAFGRIDVLVTVVGMSVITPTTELDEDSWDLDMSRNLRYVFLCSKAVGKVMIRHQIKGNIISISSLNGINASPNQAAYGASKAGLLGLVRSLAIEWAPYGIRVNAVAPGATNTHTLHAWLNQKPALRRRMLDNIPLGRIGEPEDMAGAVLWLASNLAAYVTGQTLVVDGGMLLNNVQKLGLLDDKV